jgi:DUF1365 family protein
MGSLTPRLIKGLVGHRRLGPVSHAFLTPAFYVQIPLKSLTEQGQAARAGNWAWGVNRPALLSVHDKDHGDGGPLLAWARQVLSRHGIAEPGGEIWLSTFPRMLGYVFKPVSFWFCTHPDSALGAVIVEVNNTFGGRHIYVLDCADYKNGQTLEAEKAFYVSPFFPVTGRYRFRFLWNGGCAAGKDLARIEYYEVDRLSLITHMSGQAVALNARQALLAWIRYPAFSLGVIVKIHWHALQLWRKGLRLVPRPARSS